MLQRSVRYISRVNCLPCCGKKDDRQICFLVSSFCTGSGTSPADVSLRTSGRQQIKLCDCPIKLLLLWETKWRQSRRLTPFVSWLLNDWHTDTYYWCVCHSHKLYIFVQFPWSSSATPPFKARFCNIHVCLFVFITAYESSIRATRVMFCSVWRRVPSAAGVSLISFSKTELTRTVEVSSGIVFPSPFTLTKEQGLNVCYRVCG